MKKIQFAEKAHSPFFFEIKEEVQQLLAQKPNGKYANRWFWAKAGLYAVLAMGAYGFLISGVTTNAAALLAGALVYGCSCLLLTLNVAHDAVHGAVFRSKRLNKILYRSLFVPLGVSGYLWHMRHNKSHHVFPNVNGCDIDIDENPWLRLSPNHPRRWHQRFQHLYAPCVYWIVVLHTILYQDLAYLFKRQLANMRNIRHPRREYGLFALEKLIYFASIALPFTIIDLPLWQLVVGYLVMTFVMSTVFIFMLIGTHFSMDTQFPEVNEEGKLPHCWATHALETSLDWSPTSMVANSIVGGANAHAAHHLFPSVCHIHYPEISRIIMKVTRRHGITHHSGSLAHMVTSHFAFLRNMAQQPA